MLFVFTFAKLRHKGIFFDWLDPNSIGPSWVIIVIMISKECSQAETTIDCTSHPSKLGFKHLTIHTAFPGTETLMILDVHGLVWTIPSLSCKQNRVHSTGYVLRPHSDNSMGWIRHCLVVPGKNAETDLRCSFWQFLTSYLLLRKHFGCLAPKFSAS